MLCLHDGLKLSLNDLKCMFGLAVIGYAPAARASWYLDRAISPGGKSCCQVLVKVLDVNVKAIKVVM